MSACAGIDQRRADAERGRETAHGVRHRIADAQRGAVGIAGHAHHTRDTLNDLIVGGAFRKLAVHAEPGDRAIHELRIHLAQRVEMETEPRHHTGPEIFDQHVRGFDELAQNSLAAWVFQIERDRLLARIHRNERGPHVAHRRFLVGAQTPGKIAAFGVLDLDHVGAEQRQLICAKRPGEHVR